MSFLQIFILWLRMTDRRSEYGIIEIRCHCTEWAIFHFQLRNLLTAHLKKPHVAIYLATPFLSDAKKEVQTIEEKGTTMKGPASLVILVKMAKCACVCGSNSRDGIFKLLRSP